MRIISGIQVKMLTLFFKSIVSTGVSKEIIHFLLLIWPCRASFDNLKFWLMSLLENGPWLFSGFATGLFVWVPLVKKSIGWFVILVRSRATFITIWLLALRCSVWLCVDITWNAVSIRFLLALRFRFRLEMYLGRSVFRI